VRRGWYTVARDYFFRQATRVVSLITWLLGDVLFEVTNLCSVILTADCVNNEYETTQNSGYKQRATNLLVCSSIASEKLLLIASACISKRGSRLRYWWWDRLRQIVPIGLKQVLLHQLIILELMS